MKKTSFNSKQVSTKEVCKKHTSKAFQIKLLVGVCIPLLIIFLASLNSRSGVSKLNHSPMAASKEFFLIKPTIKATASVIFLHGLGDNGSGWYHAFDQLKKSDVRYIFPNAPSMPVTLNGGFVMPSWFDLKGLNPSIPEDEEGIKRAAEKIRAMIKKETDEYGIPANRIVLGGFSMGGSLALYTALTHQEKLAGVVALSSWLPLHKRFAEENLDKKGSPIFQGHGEADPMVPPTFGQMSHAILKGKRTESINKFKTYPGMGHQSCDEEMDDVSAFIDECLSSSS